MTFIRFGNVRAANSLLFSLIWLCWWVFGHGSVYGAETVGFKSFRVHPTQILAKYLPDSEPQSKVRLRDISGMKVVDEFSLVPGLVLFDWEGGLDPVGRVRKNLGDPGGDLRRRIAELKDTGLFEYVEPDYLVHAYETPQDAKFVDGTLWALGNTGQNGGLSGADIGAVNAWDLSTGSSNVIVGIIDSGIRYTHRDLAAQMWRNPGEIPGNGIDDDGDGYPDNVFGINAMTRSGDPFDDDGHGTHVAGTIGAAANDGNGHVGVAWNVRLMACKFLDSEGDGFDSDAIRCINFAVQNGARILNNSWGGGGFNRSLQNAIAAARSKGVLFVVAAGNDSNDNDKNPDYPSCYDVDNILSVAAVDRRDKLGDFSNFGASSVDLGAPGVEIYSTSSGSDSDYKLLNGTSMATPHVSGVAALLLARFPEMSMSELRKRILESVVPVDSLRGRTVTGGRLNAFRALNTLASGQLEFVVTPGSNEPLLVGTTVPITVAVTDLTVVTNATVHGSSSGGIDLAFRNDGIAPNAVPFDGVYTANLVVPEDLSGLTLTVMASAPGKLGRTNTFDYAVRRIPANDNFSDAFELTGYFDERLGSNVGAGKESGEPEHDGTVGGRSVWWSWVAPADGIATCKTVDSDFDTILAVYGGDSVDQLSAIASDDDSGVDETSVVTFGVFRGQTYRIAVDGFNGVAGEIHLQLGLAVPPEAPSNDRFENAMVVQGSDFIQSWSNLDATKEVGEPDHGNNVGGKSVWWSWTAPQDGVAVVRVKANGLDPLLAVYTGEDVSSLTWVVGDSGDFSGVTEAEVGYETVAGVVYRIAVDGNNLGFGASTGGFTLILSSEGTSPPPVNDTFVGLEFGSIEGVSDSEQVMPITVSGFVNVASLQFSVRWDPAVVRFKGVQDFGVPSLGAGNFGTTEIANGTLRVSWDDLDGGGRSLTDGAELFGIRFQLIGEPDRSTDVMLSGTPLPIEAIVVNQDLLSQVRVVSQNGVIKIRSNTIRISGKVLFHADQVPVSDVTVTLVDATSSNPTTTSAEGKFEITADAGRDYKLTADNEVGADITAGVSTLDIALMRRHILGIQILDTPFKILAGDVNDSKTVSTLDIALVRRVILAIENSFPGGSWAFVPSDLVFDDPLDPWLFETSRSYLNQLSDAFDQDFIAIKHGDVNGSWGPSLALASGQSGSRRNRPSVKLRIGDATEETGETGGGADGTNPGSKSRIRGQQVLVQFPVRVSGAVQLTTAQFTLRWDPSQFAYEGVGDYGLPGLDVQNFGTRHVGKGLLSFSWDDPNGTGINLTEGTEMFGISLRRIAPGPGLSKIEFVGSPTIPEITLNVEPTDLVTEDREIELEARPEPPLLRVTPGAPGDPIRLTVPTEPGVLYVVESCETLVGGEWRALEVIEGDGNEHQIEDATSRTSVRFYRIRSL